MSWFTELVRRLVVAAAPRVIEAVADEVEKRLAKKPPAPGHRTTDPVYARHAWDPYEPGPGLVKRERPVCAVCLVEQTPTNVNLPCYGPPPRSRPD